MQQDYSGGCISWQKGDISSLNFYSINNNYRDITTAGNNLLRQHVVLEKMFPFKPKLMVSIREVGLDDQDDPLRS